MSEERVVTIFGTSHAIEGDGVFEQAMELGGLLAARGCTIANGGYGGTMRAAAEARQAGGQVIGVTCSAFRRAVAQTIRHTPDPEAVCWKNASEPSSSWAVYFVLPRHGHPARTPRFGNLRTRIYACRQADYNCR